MNHLKEKINSEILYKDNFSKYALFKDKKIFEDSKGVLMASIFKTQILMKQLKSLQSKKIRNYFFNTCL